ncbi:MAG: PAS domain S-box protein [Ignavibacteria bacterium]|nr:PAS domain S-box protein [Ignavibacteria bacterium]
MSLNISKYRFIVTFGALCILCVVVGIFAYYYSAASNTRNAIAMHFVEQSRLKQQVIREWANDTKRKCDAIAENYAFQPGLQQFIENRSPILFSELQKYIKDKKLTAELKSIYLITNDFTSYNLLTSASYSYFTMHRERLAKILTNGNSTLSDIMLDSATGRLYMDYFYVVKKHRNKQDAQAAAILCFRMAPEESLFKLLGTHAVAYPSTELVITHRENDSVKILSPLLFSNSAPLYLSYPVNGAGIFNTPLNYGSNELYEAQDYRGETCYGYAFEIPEYQWVLVYKIDKHELLADAFEYSLFFLVLACAFIIIFTLVLYIFWKKQNYTYETALQQAEVQQKALVTHFDYLTRYAKDIVLLIDDQGNILQANEQAVETYYYSADDLCKMNLDDLCFSAEDRVIPKLFFAARSRGSAEAETVHSRADNIAFPVEISARWIKIEGRNYYHTIIRDITEKKLSEREKQESEEKYRLIVENSSDLVVKFDAGGRLLYISPSYCRTFGKTEQELLGTRFLPGLFDGEQQEFQSLLKRLLFPPYKCYFEQQVELPEGNIWIAWNHSVLFDNSGAIDSIIGLGRDITERKITEQALYESEVKFRSMVENSPIGIFLLNGQGALSYINDAALQLADISLNDIKEGTWVASLHPEDRDDIISMGLNALQQKKSFHCSGRCIRKDSSVVWWDASTSLIISDGVIRGHVGFIANLTERVVAEEEVVYSREQLKLLAAHLISIREEERAAVARELHDELGQLLTSIKMNVTLLSKEVNKYEITAAYQYILDELQYISGTIDKSVKGLRKVITDLRPQVLENLGLLAAMDWQLQDFKKASCIPYDFNCAIDEISLDKSVEVTVFRIFQEALTNVIRHSKATFLKVKVEVNDDQLVVSIADNGIGLNPDTVDRRKSFGIMGMHERLSILGGNMKIHSAPKDGTSLIITIPMQMKVIA